MKSCSTTLLTLLNSATSLCMAELFVFTLTDGTIFRFTSLPYTFKCGSYNYSPLPIDTGDFKQSLGFSVDELSLTMYYDTDTLTINEKSVYIPRALRSGSFRYAVCEYYQVFMESWALSATEDYRLLLFAGRTEVESAGRSKAELKIKSFNDILSTKSPPNLYQAGCVNCLYGYVCGLDEDDWTEQYTLLASSTKSTLYVSCAHSASYYQGGYVKFKTGDNYGLSRTIKSHTYDSSTGIATLNLMWTLEYTPETGNKVKFIAGCDHTMALCKSRFSNYDNYRGTPFIPVPRVSGG